MLLVCVMEWSNIGGHEYTCFHALMWYVLARGACGRVACGDFGCDTQKAVKYLKFRKLPQH